MDKMKYAFLVAYLVPCLVVAGYVLGGWWHFLTPLVIFVLVPLMDLLVGTWKINLEEDHYRQLKDVLYFRLITYAYVPCQFALVGWAAYIAASGSLQTFEWVGFVISTGIVSGGIGITIAHELGHRTGRFEQNLAKALLSMVWYMHFFIEHNQGHHARVATPEDAATARFGESFYAFYPRTVSRSFGHAWSLERRRLERRKLNFWSYHNQMLWFLFWPALLSVVLFLVWGPLALAFFLIQSVVAFSLLELVNYVEHYGLQRQQTGPTSYEKVRPVHSWNAAEVVTNSLLFNLQRHSDHHANANRRYQTLRHFEESPQLPTGYAGMILLALVPPLWRRVMDGAVMALRTSQ